MEKPLHPVLNFDRELRLIETLRSGPEGFPRLELHLARLSTSAQILGISCDLNILRSMLAHVEHDIARRVRITLAPDGQFELIAPPLAPAPARWRIALASERLDSADPWLRLKTNRRKRYDQARAALPDGLDEWVFLNAQGALCEGTISSLFLRRGDRLLTPALSCGLLPGVLRASLLASGQAEEAVLTPDDLHRAEALFIGNSLRGLIPAELA